MEACAEVAGADLAKPDQGKARSDMPTPPGLLITNTDGETAQHSDSPITAEDVPPSRPLALFRAPGKGKRVAVGMSPPPTIPPTTMTARASEDLPRSLMPPLERGAKRVVSMPPGGLTRCPRGVSPFAKPEVRPLRLPPKLSGAIWRDVPASWREGVVDPLRCHSVDNLSQLEGQNARV